ncbi:ADP-ribosylation factor-like protein 8 [Diplonema papillatum]|nr:ADP-ribosylation factor-like protein 8 [Diplonema papillatum]
MGPLQAKLKDLFGGNKRIELCLVGLENSGKTTLLNILSSGYPAETMPTVGLNVKAVKKEGVMMKVWDLGGQERFRGEWPRYTQGCDVIVFVVASNDFERIHIAKKELHKLLEDRHLHGLPLLIVLNKIDLDPHMVKEDVIKEMNLDYISENTWMITQISATQRTNITEVVDWLTKHAKK